MTSDIDGEDRTIFGAPDLGFDEVSDIALDPSAASRHLDGVGNPVNVFTINGSDGGLDRRVELTLSDPISFEMAAPAGAASAGFAIFGVIGIPTYLDPVSLPFGLGNMAVLPCPLSPALEGLAFTLTDNTFNLPCTPLLSSTPAPWSSGPLGTLPFPIQLSFQGGMQDGLGGIALTNMVILDIQ